jgi:hypothetical protein
MIVIDRVKSPGRRAQTVNDSSTESANLAHPSASRPFCQSAQRFSQKSGRALIFLLPPEGAQVRSSVQEVLSGTPQNSRQSFAWFFQK